MKILIVIILSIFLYPPLTTQESKNQIICHIVGSDWKSTYVFDINKLPERCEIIVIGQYAFDRDDGGSNTRFAESDKGVISTLIAANKPVYTLIGFLRGDSWSTVFYPSDAEVFQTSIFDPLIDFLNTTKVNGIIINCLQLYDYDGKIENFAQKISNFVCAIKGKVDNLIVGLMISGTIYESFPDKNHLLLDLYIIDLSVLNECNDCNTKTDMSPITSTSPNATTIEKVTSGVTSSSMDKSKIYALLQVFPLLPKTDVPQTRLATYSSFCAADQRCSWCTIPSQLSYDQGVYAKKFYVGIVADALDTDDYESKCECGPFPVSNLIFDGWTGCPFKDCLKLDCN